MEIEFFRYKAFEEATRQVKEDSEKLQKHFQEERRLQALKKQQSKQQR